MNNQNTSHNRTEKQFVLHVQSERRIIDQHVGVSAKSAETATEKFNKKWNGFEVKVSVPHSNGHKHETVFAPTEQSAGVAATGRSGEYSDVPGEVQPLGIDVHVVEIIPEDDVETLKQERALAELSRIQYEVDNAQ